MMIHQERVSLKAPISAAGLCFEVDGPELLDAKARSHLQAKSLRRYRRWAALYFDTPVKKGDSVDVDLTFVFLRTRQSPRAMSSAPLCPGQPMMLLHGLANNPKASRSTRPQERRKNTSRNSTT